VCSTNKNANPNSKIVRNDELHTYVSRCRDEVNNIIHHLGYVEKGHKELGEGKKVLTEVQKELRDKIDRLLEKENKIDELIKQGKTINRLIELSDNQWEEQIRMRGNDKDETTKRLNDHSERIEQLTK